MKEVFHYLKFKMFKRNIESYDINYEELLQKQNKGAYIVDVRSSQEFEEGHLNGAINIPYYEINKNVQEILKDKNREIVLYCEAGIRSKRAYRRLKKLEYEKIFNLYGGLDSWL